MWKLREGKCECHILIRDIDRSTVVNNGSMFIGKDQSQKSSVHWMMLAYKKGMSGTQAAWHNGKKTIVRESQKT